MSEDKKVSYSLEWKYGENPRDDYIEITKSDKTTIILKRWSTFKSYSYPNGAIVTGFRGRRDYKDGKCQGIMCCIWCTEKNNFLSPIFTISNGYNSSFSEKDFETIEIIDEKEFIFYNTDAIKNIKKQLK